MSSALKATDESSSSCPEENFVVTPGSEFDQTTKHQSLDRLDMSSIITAAGGLHHPSLLTGGATPGNQEWARPHELGHRGTFC
jgi:hypothetical protein